MEKCQQPQAHPDRCGCENEVHCTAHVDYAPETRISAGGEVEVLALFDQVIGRDPQAYLAGSTVYQVTESEVLAFASAHVTRLQAELAKADYTNKILMEQAAEFGDLLESLTAERDEYQRMYKRVSQEGIAEAHKCFDLQRERDSLKTEVTNKQALLSKALDNTGLVLDELTKAQELIDHLYTNNELSIADNEKIEKYLAHQSAPATKCESLNHKFMGGKCSVCGLVMYAPAAKDGE